MVEINVEYNYPIDLVFKIRMCGSDRDIVDETKTRRSIFPAVMSWWSNCDKSAFDRILVIYDSINSLAHCPECPLNRVD